MTTMRRIGEILVKQGILCQDQVQAILDRQKQEKRPFGALAAEMYGLNEQVLWQAWGEQMLPFMAEVDLGMTPSTDEALAQVDGRDAWAQRMLPLRIEDGNLVLGCTRESMPKALGWASRHLEGCPDLVLCELDVLEQQILERYAKYTERVKNGSTEAARRAG